MMLQKLHDNWKENFTTNLNIYTFLYIVTCRVKESLGPLRGGISGSLRFGDPVGVAVAERDRPGRWWDAPIAVPGVLWWWCRPDEPIWAEEITPVLSLGIKSILLVATMISVWYFV